MTPSVPSRPARIRASQVELLTEPVILGGDAGTEETITVAPLVEGKRIRCLDIRCSCGQQLRVDCVYGDESEEPEQATPTSEE